MNFWRYRQLHHFFERHGHTIRDPLSLTPFEQLFVQEEPVTHMVSELYKLLGSAAQLPKPIYIRKWERDLGTEFTDVQLSHLYYLTHSSSIDSKVQETNFKIMSRWYRVPEDLARIYPTRSDLCWRGCGHKGTLTHIWWNCPKIVPFWTDIKDQIKVITGIEVPLSPMHFLLHIPPISLKQYKKNILPHLLNVARRLLPIYWRQSKVPTREDWIKGVSAVREAEEWLATCRGSRERFLGIWAPWSEYTTDSRDIPSSLDIALLELADPTLRARRQSRP